MTHRIHALGAILYECLVGELPSSGDDLRFAWATLSGQVPRSLAEVVTRALAGHVDRYDDMRQFAHALRAASEAGPLPAPVEHPRGRRRQPRARYVTPVVVERACGTTLEARSEDLPEGGMLVIVRAAVPAGERIQVSFALPSTGAFMKQPAIVRWARATRDDHEAIGIEFIDPSPTVLADVADYVESCRESEQGDGA